MKKIFLCGAFVLIGANAYAYTCCTDSTGHACEAFSADYCCTGCSECMSFAACGGSIIDGPISGFCIDNCPSTWDGQDWSEVSDPAIVAFGLTLYVRTTCTTESVDGLCTNVYTPTYSCSPGGYPVSNDQGYYCNFCPDSETSAEYNTDITGCYVPADSARSDETGTYVFSGSDCHYSVELDIEL